MYFKLHIVKFDFPLVNPTIEYRGVKLGLLLLRFIINFNEPLH